MLQKTFKELISLPDETKLKIIAMLGVEAPVKHPDTQVLSIGCSVDVEGVASIIPSGQQRWTEDVNRILLEGLDFIDRADILRWIEEEQDYCNQLDRVRAVLLGRWTKEGEAELVAALDAERERGVEILDKALGGFDAKE